MKSLFIVSLFGFLSIFSTEMKAQSCCPTSSYTPYTISRYYPGSNCIMEITFCYLYLQGVPSSTMAIKLCEITFDINSCQGVNVVFDSEFWEYVDDEILSKADSLNPIDPCEPGAPENYYTVLAKFTKPYCYEIVNDYVQQMSILKSCGTGSADCVSWYEVCRDNGELKKVLGYGPTKHGDDFCPEPGNGPFTIETVGCFSSCY